jgi:hypothetical protein
MAEPMVIEPVPLQVTQPPELSDAPGDVEMAPLAAFPSRLPADREGAPVSPVPMMVAPVGVTCESPFMEDEGRLDTDDDGPRSVNAVGGSALRVGSPCAVAMLPLSQACLDASAWLFKRGSSKSY